MDKDKMTAYCRICNKTTTYKKVYTAGGERGTHPFTINHDSKKLNAVVGVWECIECEDGTVSMVE